MFKNRSISSPKNVVEIIVNVDIMIMNRQIKNAYSNMEEFKDISKKFNKFQNKLFQI